MLMADPERVAANTGAARYLEARDVPARWLETPFMHAKAVLVDGDRAYVGSINLSLTSLTKNREVGVVVQSRAQVQRMSATFDGDWRNARAF